MTYRQAVLSVLRDARTGKLPLTRKVTNAELAVVLGLKWPQQLSMMLWGRRPMTLEMQEKLMKVLKLSDERMSRLVLGRVDRLL